MKTEYAGINGSEKIPLFVDSSPGWMDYQDISNNSIKPISTDISAGMQEYIFGRNIGTNDFGIGAGMVVANSNEILLTGAGIKKKSPVSSSKPKKKSPISSSKPEKKSPVSSLKPKKKSPVSSSKPGKK